MVHVNKLVLNAEKTCRHCRSAAAVVAGAAVSAQMWVKLSVVGGGR